MLYETITEAMAQAGMPFPLARSKAGDVTPVKRDVMHSIPVELEVGALYHLCYLVRRRACILQNYLLRPEAERPINILYASNRCLRLIEILRSAVNDIRAAGGADTARVFFAYMHPISLATAEKQTKE